MHDRTSRPALRRALLGGSAAALLSALSAPAFAQDREGVLLLDRVTLLGTGLETSVFESPSSVTVIDAGQLRRIPPASVAQLLSGIPGVMVTEEGIERIRIRGENSRRVTIQIDGQDLTDHTTYGTPILVDPTTIERIEILRGASSVVSGSRAVGGVINIVTKTGGEDAFSGSAQAGYFSATDGYRTALSFGGARGAFDYRLSLGKSEMGDRETPDGVLERSGSADSNLSAHLGYRLDNHYFALKAQRYDLSAEVHTGDPNFFIDLPGRDLRKIGLFYEGTNLAPWLKVLKADAYLQTVDRVFVNDIVTGPMRIVSDSIDAQRTFGFNLGAELELIAGQRTAAGLEFEDDFLDADKVSTVSPPFGPPVVSLRNDEARIRTLSAYVNHEIDLGPALTAHLGGRYYHVKAELEQSDNAALSDNTDSLLLGAAGLVWTPREDLALRASYSQGYSYPTLAQMFLTTTGGGITLTGNPDLEPERSDSIELGLRYDAGATVIDAAIFYSESEDYIATVTTGTTGTYENVDAARAWGLELSAEHRIGDFTPYVSALAMRRQLRYANGFNTFDSGSPELSGKLGLRWDWAAGSITGTLDAYLQGEGYAAQRGQTGALQIEAAGYTTLNLRADMELTGNFHVTAGLYNITDKRYDPIDQLQGAERNLQIFATYRF